MKLSLKVLILLAVAYSIFGFQINRVEETFALARDPHTHVEGGGVICYDRVHQVCMKNQPTDDEGNPVPSTGSPEPPN